jgi:twitching motility protein PilT
MSPSAATRTEWARRFAQALIAAGTITEADATPLIDEARTSGAPFGWLVLSRGLASPQVVLSTASQLAQLPTVDLYSDRPTADAVQAVPPSVGHQYRAVGLRNQDGHFVVAFAEPPDADDLRSLGALVGLPVLPVLADPVAVELVLTAQSSVSAPAAAAPAAGAPPAPAPAPSAPSGAASHSGNGSSAPATAATNGGSPAGQDLPLHIDDLLRYAVTVGASDLHLTTGMPGCIRLNGAIRPIEGCPVLDNEGIREMIFGILPASQRERFEEEKELDTSHSITGAGRFRLNVFQQRGTIAAVLRAIPHEIPSFETLAVPESVRGFTELRRGLVLVTGPTGSGKSTTLASLVDIINRTKPLHIITVEDPIEFLHTHKRAVVNQREVGEDTKSFSEALRRVLREDPDVILVGEMRDLETIQMALTAAETGHLVFGTLHTQDCPQTIDRIIDVFPTNQQEQVRTMLAAALEGVVTQQLILNADGAGRLAACEVMICTSAIRNLVRSNKTHQIYSLMQTGAQYGMQTMDQGLAKLVREGRISEAVAFDRCRNEDDLRNHLNS